MWFSAAVVLRQCHMRTLSCPFSSISVCYSINTSCTPLLISPHMLIFKKTPTNENTHKHAQFKLSWLHHSKETGFVMFCGTEGVTLPLCDTIRELCCSQIELSELLPFNPPFHMKNTQTHRRLSKVTRTKWRM